MSIVKEYDYFDNISAVLDVARFSISNDVFRTDKSFIIQGLEEFGMRYTRTFNKLNPNLDINDYFHVQINYELAQTIEGTIIDIQEFWGKGYDITNNEINLFQYSENCRSSNIFSGLAHALLDPPYGLKRPSKVPSKLSRKRKKPESDWLLELVHKFNKDVLKIDINSSCNHLIIEEWPVNWSNYFEAGNEWWGSFLWSVLDRSNKWVTIIGASSTD